MLDLSSHIVLPLHLKSEPCNAPQSSLANSSVLDYLLPQLSSWHNRPQPKQQALEKIDGYMLQETELLLEKLTELCMQCSLPDNLQFRIDLSTVSIDSTTEFEGKRRFIQSVKQDKWVIEALNWLLPNYLALAHSQELVDFSHAYANHRQYALSEFKHFSQANQGMQCYISCVKTAGKIQVEWCVESPVNCFIVY